MNKRSIPQTYLKKPSGRLPSFRHHLPSPAPTARLPFLFSSSCSSLSSHHVLLPKLPKNSLSISPCPYLLWQATTCPTVPSLSKHGVSDHQHGCPCLLPCPMQLPRAWRSPPSNVILPTLPKWQEG